MISTPSLRIALALLTLSFSILAQASPEVDALTQKRNDAVSKIDASYKAELEKLKAKFMQQGNLDDANAAAKLADAITVSNKVTPSSISGPNEFDNSEWEFRNKKSLLSKVTLRTGGKIESKEKEHSDSTWRKIDKDSIEWTYSGGVKMVMKFNPARTLMTGTHPTAKTERYLVIPASAIKGGVSPFGSPN